MLDELDLPHPPTVLVRTRRELEAAGTPPCYIKLAYSTAGCGVWRVSDRGEMPAVTDRLEAAGLLDGRFEVLVQQPAPGVLRVIQAVYQRGRLVGAHCSQARAQGVGGSAWARESVLDPLVLEHLAALGAHLDWHGGLCMDYLHDPETGRPSYIDANPRPGETLNATLSGLNLSQRLVQVSRDQDVPPLPPPQPGVRTHTVVMALMALAHEGAPRHAFWPSCAGPGLTRALRCQPGRNHSPPRGPSELDPSLLFDPAPAPEPLRGPTHRGPHGGQLLLVRGRRAGHPPDPRRHPGPSQHREPITVG